MSTGPPFRPDQVTSPPENWEEMTTPLDYPDRDIRLIYLGGDSMFDGPYMEPRLFGDFSPTDDDPDPDVWPLEGYDPGHPADVDDLILWGNSFPAPHAAWVTEEYLKSVYGYNPRRQTLDVEELPPWQQSDTAKYEGTADVVSGGAAGRQMRLTHDRRVALERLGRLWNGERVRGHHLLRDKLPSWTDLFGDLDQDDLKRLVIDPDHDYEFAEAFGDHPWYEQEASVYLAPKTILRKKVWYSPTLKGRTLINRHSAFPPLEGDPREGLPHRVAVGLATIRERHHGRDVETYCNLNGYTVDIVSRDPNGQLYAGEVLTSHHNWTLHRNTYRKLVDLHNQGIVPCAVFDTRETAYQIFNHWHNHEALSAELPNGAFGSEPNVSTGQKQIREAYEGATSWVVESWTTTSDLWSSTIGDPTTTIDPAVLFSTNW